MDKEMTELSNFGLSYIKGRDINVDAVLLCTKSEFTLLNIREPSKPEIYCYFALTNNGAIIKR